MLRLTISAGLLQFVKHSRIAHCVGNVAIIDVLPLPRISKLGRPLDAAAKSFGNVFGIACLPTLLLMIISRSSLLCFERRILQIHTSPPAVQASSARLA